VGYSDAYDTNMAAAVLLQASQQVTGRVPPPPFVPPFSTSSDAGWISPPGSAMMGASPWGAPSPAYAAFPHHHPPCWVPSVGPAHGHFHGYPSGMPMYEHPMMPPHTVQPGPMLFPPHFAAPLDSSLSPMGMATMPPVSSLEGAYTTAPVGSEHELDAPPGVPPRVPKREREHSSLGAAEEALPKRHDYGPMFAQHPLQWPDVKTPTHGAEGGILGFPQGSPAGYWEVTYPPTTIVTAPPFTQEHGAMFPPHHMLPVPVALPNTSRPPADASSAISVEAVAVDGPSLVIPAMSPKNERIRTAAPKGGSPDHSIVDLDALAAEGLDIAAMAKRGRETRSAAAQIPDQSLMVLFGWLIANLHWPFPDKATKVQLAREAGLEPLKVKYWFSNVRKRHWVRVVANGESPRSQMDVDLLQVAEKRGLPVGAGKPAFETRYSGP
jgi:hypothetical protein